MERILHRYRCAQQKLAVTVHSTMVSPRLKVPPSSSAVIDRRRSTDEDRDFLFGLFCRSLALDNPLLLLPRKERDPLLRRLFDAREERLRATYTLADFDVLAIDGKPVGSLYVDRGKKEFVLIDISILPDYRDQGIGTAVLSSLLEEAGRLVLPVRARVLHRSPAWRLWQRLGFELTGNDGAYADIVVPAIRTD